MICYCLVNTSLREIENQSQTESDRQASFITNLPLIKRQVFCFRDRLKMGKHRPETTLHDFVAPKSVWSMTTKGLISLSQMRWISKAIKLFCFFKFNLSTHSFGPYARIMHTN